MFRRAKNAYQPRVVAVVCSWEGKCRSGITPAMLLVLCSIYTYGLNGLKKEISTPLIIL